MEGPCMCLTEVTPGEGGAEGGCLPNAPHPLSLVPRHCLVESTGPELVVCTQCGRVRTVVTPDAGLGWLGIDQTITGHSERSSHEKGKGQARGAS